MTGGESTVCSAVKDTYRAMVKTMPFSKITISELCKRANVSRKTFYEYFSDKEALLKSILHDDLIKGTESLKPLFANADAAVSAPLLTEKMYHNVYAEREFYRALVARGSAQAFTHAAMQCFAKLHERLSQREGARLSTELRYASRFGAAASAAVLIQWVRDDFAVPPHELAQWMSDWGMASSSVGFLP